MNNVPLYDTITAQDPWFLRLWQKFGVKSKKTATNYTLIVVVLLLAISIINYARISSGPGVDKAQEEAAAKVIQRPNR